MKNNEITNKQKSTKYNAKRINTKYLQVLNRKLILFGIKNANV